jgi:hypothetical protein
MDNTRDAHLIVSIDSRPDKETNAPPKNERERERALLSLCGAISQHFCFYDSLSIIKRGRQGGGARPQHQHVDSATTHKHQTTRKGKKKKKAWHESFCDPLSVRSPPLVNSFCFFPALVASLGPRRSSRVPVPSSHVSLDRHTRLSVHLSSLSYDSPPLLALAPKPHSLLPLSDTHTTHNTHTPQPNIHSQSMQPRHLLHPPMASWLTSWA